MLEKPTDAEKPGEEKDDKKKGEKDDKASKDDKSKDAGKKGKDKDPEAKEGSEQDEDDRSMRSDRSFAGMEGEETLDIVTTPRAGPSPSSPRSKPRGPGDEEKGPFPPSGAGPRGKKRGKFAGIFGRKDKPGGPGGAKRPKIRLPGAGRDKGKDKGSPPSRDGRGKSKPSAPGGKTPQFLLPPGVKKPTTQTKLKIPRI